MTTERWALVPAEATPEMINAGYDVRPVGQFIPGFTAQESADYCEKYFGRQTLGARHSAMIQASPGAALLAEVLAARDAYLSAVRDGGTSSESRKNRTDTHYALFAALDKISPWHHEEADKLGPAAEKSKPEGCCDGKCTGACDGNPSTSKPTGNREKCAACDGFGYLVVGAKNDPNDAIIPKSAPFDAWWERKSKS